MLNSPVEQTMDEIQNHALSAEMRNNYYQFLAGMINNRPNKTIINSLISGREEALRDNDAIEEPIGEYFLAIQEMYSFFDIFSNHTIEELETMLSVDWTRLFRGVVKGYGPPPPFEALYSNAGHTDIALMIEVNRQYREAGFVLGDAQPNRSDYLGVELEFLSILAGQEATAWEKGDYATAQIKLHTTEKFINEHLNHWVNKYCEIAQKSAKTHFYRGILRMVKISGDRKELDKALKPVLIAE